MKAVPESLRETWPCLRLVMERAASMTELETTLSVDDAVTLADTCDFWRVLTAPQDGGSR